MLLSPPTSSAALWRHCAGAAAALGACAGSARRLLTSGAHAYDFRFGGREGAEESGRRLRAAPRREQLRQAGSSPGGGSPALLPVEKSCRLCWGEEAAWARGSGLQRSVRDRRPTKAPPGDARLSTCSRGAWRCCHLYSAPVPPSSMCRASA